MMRRRWLCFLLSICMVVTYIPQMAAAKDIEKELPAVESKNQEEDSSVAEYTVENQNPREIPSADDNQSTNADSTSEEITNRDADSNTTQNQNTGEESATTDIENTTEEVNTIGEGETTSETVGLRKIEAFSAIATSLFSEKGTALEEISLPTSIGVILEGELDTMMLPVQWKCVTEGGYHSNPKETMTYLFKPYWDEEQYILGDNLTQEEVPFIHVTILAETTVKGKKAAVAKSFALQNDSAEELKSFSDENKINPLTGDNDATTAAGDVYAELLLGKSSTNEKREAFYYDWLSMSHFWPQFSTGVLTFPRETPAYKNEDSQGERVIGVRTVAFDPLGEGQTRYTAELSAEQRDGKTAISLNVYRVADSDGPVVMHGSYSGIACLNFVPKEWQIGGYLSMAAGDYNGDGRDELAVYCPNGVGLYGMQNDMPQERPAPAVVIMKAVEGISPDPAETREVYRMEVMDQTNQKEENYFFDPYYLYTGTNHTIEHKIANNIETMFVVDLQAVSQPGDRQDDLAIAVSPPKHGTTSFNILAHTKVDLWKDPVKGLKNSQLDSFDMQWDLNNLDKNKFSAGSQRERMMFGGICAGDTDNDNNSEVVISGYRLSDTKGSNWKIDNRWYLVQQLEYDKEKKKYKEAGNVPQGVKVEKQLASSKIAMFYGGADAGSAGDVVMEPMASLCYKGRGSAVEDLIFIGGCVYEWNKNHKYSGPYENKNGTVSGGYKILFTVTPFGAMTTTIDAEHFPEQKLYRDTFEKKTGASSRRWYSQPTAGIFNENKLGIEQLFCMYTMDCGTDGSVGEVILATSENTEAKDFKETFTGTKPCYKYVTIRSHFLEQSFLPENSSHIRTICAVDPDQDTALASYQSTEVYYSNSVPISVLQAAPFHEELGEKGSMNYATAGYTTFGVSSSSGSSTGNAFSASVGAILGMEQEVSFFGMASSGIEASTEIYAGAGMENILTKSTTYNQSFTANGEDMVVAMVTPYVRYRYNLIASGMETTTENLQETKKQINKLKAQLETYPKEDRAPYEEKIQNLEEQVKQYRIIIASASSGTVNEDGTVEISYSIPGRPIVTIMSKDNYNDINTVENQITDSMLGNSRVGDVGSYVRSSKQKPSNLNLSDSIQVTKGMDPGFFSHSFTLENSYDNSVTWEAGMDSSLVFSAGGVKAGVSYKLNYNGSYTTINAKDTTMEGGVGVIPNDEDVSTSYGFIHQLGWWQQMVGNNRCTFIGHFVTPNGQNMFPPKPVENIQAEPKLSGEEYKGAILSWEKSKKMPYNLTASEYEIYINGLKRDSLTPVITDTGVTCDVPDSIMGSDQNNTIRIVAVAGSAGNKVKSVASEEVDFFYLSNAKISTLIKTHPSDVTLDNETCDENGEELLNHTISFETVVDTSDLSIIPDTGNWEWQKKEIGGLWRRIDKEEPGYVQTISPNSVTKELQFIQELTVQEKDAGTKYRALMPIGIDANKDSNIDKEDPNEYFVMTSKEVVLLAADPPIITDLNLDIIGENGMAKVTVTAQDGSGRLPIDIMNLTNNGISVQKELLYTDGVSSNINEEIMRKFNELHLKTGIYQAVASLPDGSKAYSNLVLCKPSQGSQDTPILAIHAVCDSSVS